MTILPFPELRQVYAYDCGASALQSVLVWAGINEREDKIMHLAATEEKEGTTIDGLLRVLDLYGLPRIEGQGMYCYEIRRAIRNGHPTIITLQAYRDNPDRGYLSCWDDGHYVVAIGYDEHGIIFEDPSAFSRTYLTDVELCERWHDRDGDDRIHHWGCQVLAEGKFVPGAVQHME